MFHLQDKHDSLQSNVEYKELNILSYKHTFSSTTALVHDILARNSDNLIFSLEI